MADQQTEGQQTEGQQTESRVGAREAARQAIAYMEEMTGQPPEVVSGLEPDGDDWRVTVEMLELPRVPDSCDVLGCYQVTVGSDGEPVSYRRLRRYSRGQVDEGRL